MKEGIEESVRAKKLLILSSFGGYGHRAAANTLLALLGGEYETKIIYPIKELKICGVSSGELFYNFLISHNLYSLTNWITRLVPRYVFKPREEKICRMIEKHIEKYRPDLVISLIPFINYPATEAARKQSLPFLLITTDNDLQNWVFGLEKKIHQNFKVTIGSDLPSSKGLLLQRNIPSQAIETIGLPLRPNFLEYKDKVELRKKHGVASHKDVVLIMMGGMGAKLTYQYAQIVLRSLKNVHLLVCTGRNQKLAKRLETIETKGENSLHIIPFTEKVHELFVLADLAIIKPGPGTMNEALTCKLPILIDRTNTPLFWEQINIDLVCQFKIGACVHSFKEVPALLNRFLHDPITRETVTRAYEQIPKNQFSNKIGQIVGQMCGEKIELKEYELSNCKTV